jgi:hypothetical protein
MSEFSTKLLVVMLVLLAGVPEASPPKEPTVSPPTQLVVRQTRKSGRNRESSAVGAISAVAPGLCFQSGVGWRSILPEPPGAPGRNSSIGFAAVSPISAAHATQCAGILANKRVLEAEGEKFDLSHLSRTMRSAGPAKSGEVASHRADSPLTRPTNLASAAEPDAGADQVGALPFRAYASPIKLRRLIRKAPDFKTRIKLQQLQSGPGIQPRKEKAGKETSATAGKPLRGERADRTSSRGMGISDRPQGHSHGLGESR